MGYWRIGLMVLTVLALDLVGGSAFAQESVEAKKEDAVRTVPWTARSSPTAIEDEWWESYGRARAAMLEERYEDASTMFHELVATAPSSFHKRLALELAMITDALGGAHLALRPDERRTNDELSFLYSTSFVYGFGTSAWLTLQLRPGSFAGAVIPFAVLTTASVGSVAIADGYRPFPRGVPHSIASGLYVGFGEAMWVVGLQHSGATRRDDGSRWSAAETATVLWTGATVGGIVGGVVGFQEHPRPGRVSFAASTAFWSGLAPGLIAGAIQPNPEYRGETAFIAAGAGYNLGLLVGVLAPVDPAPSVSRVRLIDVGGLGGGLLGLGTYAAIRGKEGTPRGGIASAAAGAGVGLSLAWWLTQGMVEKPKPDKSRSLDSLGQSFRPTLSPTMDGGWVVGVTGEL